MTTVLRSLCLLMWSCQALCAHTMPLELSDHASLTQVTSDLYLLKKFPLDDETAEDGIDFIVWARGLNINRPKTRWHLVEYIYEKYMYSTPILTQWLIYRLLDGVNRGDVIGMAAVELNKQSLRIGYHFPTPNIQTRNETHSLLKAYYCAMMGEKIFSIAQLEAHDPINSFPIADLKVSSEACRQFEGLKINFYNTATPEAKYDEILGYNDVGDRFDFFDISNKAHCPVAPDNTTSFMQMGMVMVATLTAYYMMSCPMVFVAGSLWNLCPLVRQGAQYMFVAGYRYGVVVVHLLKVHMHNVFQAGMEGDVYDPDAVNPHDSSPTYPAPGHK